MTLLNGNAKAHIKTHSAFYVALFALFLSVVVNIVIVARWGTQLEETVKGHGIKLILADANDKRINAIENKLNLIDQDIFYLKVRDGIPVNRYNETTPRKFEQPLP